MIKSAGFLHIFCLLLLFSACKTTTPTLPAQLTMPTGQSILLLDSTQAAIAITRDSIESFFEHIKLLDMSIQMRKNFPDGTSRTQALSAYRTFLQSEVSNFTNDEKAFIQKIFTQIYQDCHALSPLLLPNQIKLIKSKGNQYGPNAYYTRENCIVIPQQALAVKNETVFTEVMLHELFHIYSRLNPTKRAELYASIGFKSIGNLEFLQLPETLRQGVLLNPDGINYAQAIQTKDRTGRSLFAIPILRANADRYQKEKTRYFDYLDFNLYEIQPPYARLIQVKANPEDGSSFLTEEDLEDFHQQIGDNTDYIIHPDEILADNFVLIVLSATDSKRFDFLSDDGKTLLEELKNVLLKPEE